MDTATPLIVALDHPSLDRAMDAFAAELRDEPRRFGRSATPKPFPSLIRRLTEPGDLRMGAIVDGRVVGVARVDGQGDTTMAVVPPWRGRGVGTVLMEAIIERAEMHGHRRLVMRSSRRSTALAAIGTAIGATTVDMGRGRVDIIFGLDREVHTASS